MQSFTNQEEETRGKIGQQEAKNNNILKRNTGISDIAVNSNGLNPPQSRDCHPRCFKTFNCVLSVDTFKHKDRKKLEVKDILSKY